MYRKLKLLFLDGRFFFTAILIIAMLFSVSMLKHFGIVNTRWRFILLPMLVNFAYILWFARVVLKELCDENQSGYNEY